MQRGIYFFIGAAFCAAACGGGAPPLQQTAPPVQECSQLAGGSAGAAVRASSGTPALALDGNPATSWSCTSACWIVLDLGTVQQVDAVAIAWAGVPATRYQVSVSEDGASYAPPSDGVGASCQRQPLTAAQGRFVRLAIDADAAQPGVAVAELRVDASPIPTAPAPPPPRRRLPRRPHRDRPSTRSASRGSTPPSRAASPGRCRPTRAPIRASIRRTPSRRTVTVLEDEERAGADGVFTSTGYKQPASYDRLKLAAQGYMLAPNDWRNVEITGFVRVNSASLPTDNFAWYARGGHHSAPIPCEGSSYKGGLHYDGACGSRRSRGT